MPTLEEMRKLLSGSGSEPKVDKPVAYESVTQKCDYCKGTGRDKYGLLCPMCKGSKYITFDVFVDTEASKTAKKKRKTDKPDGVVRYKQCEECSGQGIIYEDGALDSAGSKCRKCRGRGYVLEKESDVRYKKAENKRKIVREYGKDVIFRVCEVCGGLGEVNVPGKPIDGNFIWEKKKCTRCKGDGFVIDKENTRSKKVKDRKDIRDKQRVIFGLDRYTISTDGDNAMLKFGRHKGRTLTQIIDKGNISYLRWILKEEFPEELKDVCRYLLRKAK